MQCLASPQPGSMAAHSRSGPAHQAAAAAPVPSIADLPVDVLAKCIALLPLKERCAWQQFGGPDCAGAGRSVCRHRTNTQELGRRFRRCSRPSPLALPPPH